MHENVCEMKFDEKSNQWVYSISSNGLTIYGRGRTQDEAKADIENSYNAMWEF